MICSVAQHRKTRMAVVLSTRKEHAETSNKMTVIRRDPTPAFLSWSPKSQPGAASPSSTSESWNQQWAIQRAGNKQEVATSILSQMPNLVYPKRFPPISASALFTAAAQTRARWVAVKFTT